MSETDNYIVTIPKDQMAAMPAAEFNGKIVMINSIEKVDDAVSALNNADEIGFDTETRPSFKRGQSYKVSLLQLSTHDTCYLFRLNKIGLPDSVKALLENPDIKKIGLSIHDDFHNLNKIAKIEPQGFIDLQPFVKDYRIADNSLTRIHSIIFGKRISKGQRLTNWEAAELTEAQQQYAALDALACLHIYDYITAGNFIPEKSPYFQAPPPPPVNPNQLEKSTSQESETDSTKITTADNTVKKKKKKKKKRKSKKKTPSI